jgi:hypothetical protein
VLHNHLRNFTSHELGIDLHAPDQADDGSDGVNQLGAGVEVGSDHVGGFRNAADTVTLGESPDCRKQHESCRKESFFHVSKILIGETKNHFDSEYIAFNSLIYKPYDACHRMSSRYISKDFPNDKKEDFGQGRMGKTENKNGHSS